MTGRSIVADQAGTSITNESGEAMARLALSYRRKFDIPALIEQGAQEGHVVAATEVLLAKLKPISQADPKFRSPDIKVLRDELGMIGRRIRPDMNPAAAKDWVAAQIIALRDLPLVVALEAVRKAQTDEIEHPGQVHSAIMRHQGPIRDRYSMALRRLRHLQAAIKNPPKALPPAEPAPPMTQADLEAMAGSDLGKRLMSLGVNSGLIVEDADQPCGYRLLENPDEVENENGSDPSQRGA